MKFKDLLILMIAFNLGCQLSVTDKASPQPQPSPEAMPAPSFPEPQPPLEELPNPLPPAPPTSIPEPLPEKLPETTPEIKPEAKKVPPCMGKSFQECPLNFTILPLPEPNQYEVVFTWEERDGRFVFRRGTEVLASENADKKLVKLSKVEAGSVFQLIVDQWIAQRGIVDSVEYTLTIPRDLVIQNEMRLSAPLTGGFGRIFFISGARLITQGHDVDLSANELISDNGGVMTFPAGTTAGNGSKGRSGGRQNWKIGSGRGHLALEVRGENGGKGDPGSPWFTRAEKGAAGSSSSIARECLFAPMSVDVDREYGCTWIWDCANHAGSGHKGAAGARGNQGFPGLNGGNSGEVSFQVVNGKGLVVFLQIEPGTGGPGGNGGPGQLGGEGGDPGNNSEPRDKYCRHGSAGPVGDTGPTGEMGPAGSAGNIEKVVIEGVTLSSR